MAEKKDKTVKLSDSQVGVIGNHVRIEGGVHFHSNSGSKSEGNSTEPAGTAKEAAEFDPAQAANILHLSDLHFGADKESDPLKDAERWYSQLTDDLCEELSCERLDAAIISGDIANFSDPEEYQAAEHFLERLCTKFRLDASRLVIVPGNHDLNWDLSEESYQLIRKKQLKEDLPRGWFYEESKNVVALRDDDNYLLRFKYFNNFYKSVTGKSYPLDSQTQATLHHLPDLNLLIVGFNSVWEADHHFKNRISINPDAVTFAREEIRERPEYENCLKFAVWHHPLNSPAEDRIKKHGFMERLVAAGFRICLHGHIHKVDADLFRYDMSSDGRRIDIVGAGTFGAPVEEWTSGYPLQYNLLRLSGHILRVEARRRIDLDGNWEPDHQWRQGKGQPNLPYYEIQLSDDELPKASREPEFPDPPSSEPPAKPQDPTLEAEIQAYCRKAESLHESLPVAGFATHLKVLIDIEEIYVPLRAMVNLKGVDERECYADARDAEKRLTSCGADREIGLIHAFPEAEKRGKKGLVILGDPGSGKTTHMKRLLLWCLRKGPETLGLPRDMLPVFLPLRELGDLSSGLDRFIQDQLTSRHLKTHPDFGRRLMDRGKLLFLLDGLDEVADLAQREEVSAWIEEAFTDYPDCRYVVTCRFAGYSPSVRLGAKFLEMHVRPLTETGAEQFVRNWYAIVERSLAKDVEQAGSIAREKADDLIDRLQQPDFRARRVFELTRNPLLLTNICLVHRHRGTLPKQRARLYEECINVLLEHWQQAKKLDLGFNALQGRQALQPAALWLHQEEGRIRATARELAPHIDPALKAIKWSGGGAEEFLKTIRNQSGLLTGWDQEHYGFMHLGFQEFLAAREIRSRFQREMNETGRSELLKALASHFGESWWQEVTLLLLALEDPPLFTPLMREVIPRPAFAKSADLVEMCLDDAVQPSPKPFIEWLKTDPGQDEDKQKGQLLALRMAARLDDQALESIIDKLSENPFDKIREWVGERFKAETQDVIRADLSGYELVLIKGGTFAMGSKDIDWARPVHEVTLPDFYMGRYPVTNEEYGRFLAETKYREPDYWADRTYNQPRQPVVGVSWQDARKFAAWAGLQLSSESQWEYACRAGTSTRYSWGDEPDCSKANYGHSSYSKECKDINPGKPSPVGNYPPNAWGLYDMHGNVWEWCEDHNHDSYQGAPDDGSARVDRDDDAFRVLRGGSWRNVAGGCRSANRGGFGPGGRVNRVGFRLVRSQVGKK